MRKQSSHELCHEKNGSDWKFTQNLSWPCCLTFSVEFRKFARQDDRFGSSPSSLRSDNFIPALACKPPCFLRATPLYNYHDSTPPLGPAHFRPLHVGVTATLRANTTSSLAADRQLPLQQRKCFLAETSHGLVVPRPNQMQQSDGS